ncbi:MAG: transglutaminase-like domain-containing protein, partial [Bryobacteraceae bacterium]
MQQLLDALRDERSKVTLDVAALELAAIEFPGIDSEASLFRLDNLAEQIKSQITGNAGGLDFIKATNELLFEVLQFRGNQEQYYDPRNSCLNSVLMRRLGIPISLSTLYIEIARRLNRTVYGVGLPGHFIVAYEDADARYWIDPFNAGRILSFADCCSLAMQTAGVDLRSNPAVLAPVNKRQILVRMLSNLKAIYLRGEAFEKARQVLDLLIGAMPDYPE